MVRHQPLEDGRSNIVVLGVGRARLVEELDDPSVPYRSARCERIDDIRTPTNPVDGVAQRLSDLRLAALQVVHGRADVTEELERLLDGERNPAEVVDVLAHMCLRCADDRLACLNLDDFSQRADHLLGVLTRFSTAHARRRDLNRPVLARAHDSPPGQRPYARRSYAHRRSVPVAEARPAGVLHQ